MRNGRALTLEILLSRKKYSLFGTLSILAFENDTEFRFEGSYINVLVFELVSGLGLRESGEYAFAILRSVSRFGLLSFGTDDAAGLGINFFFFASAFCDLRL
mgnify:CR=1 FL=1